VSQRSVDAGGCGHGAAAQIGKNYAKHKVEMGGTAERLERPCFFFKPNSSVIGPGETAVRPAGCTDLHHEIELGVVIKGRVKGLAQSEWKSAVAGYVLGVDLTARDWQTEAKATGMPWSLSKGCDTMCPLSDVIPVEAVADPHDLLLWLQVDGVDKQRGSTAFMLHKIPELIEYVSSVITLEDGDVILTGTPEGVGPCPPGSTLSCGLETPEGKALATMSFPIVAAESLRG
jgi:acylpyruvate hydrolase